MENETGKVLENVEPKKKRIPPKGGSRKGCPNKATQSAREAIALFVDGSAWRLQEWLDKVADGIPTKNGEGFKVDPNPQKAFELYMSVVEYHIPKLQRTDVLSIIKRDKGEIAPLPQYVSAEEAAAAYQEAIK